MQNFYKITTFAENFNEPFFFRFLNCKSMATAFSKDFLSAIYEFVPCAQVYTDELRTLAWGTDGSFYRMKTKMVKLAENQEE